MGYVVKSMNMNVFTDNLLYVAPHGDVGSELGNNITSVLVERTLVQLCSCVRSMNVRRCIYV